ncbi:MAG: MarR family winged helix-turn-helix transcriptional regulator [Acidimicrobiales bacterium]
MLGQREVASHLGYLLRRTSIKAAQLSLGREAIDDASGAPGGAVQGGALGGLLRDLAVLLALAGFGPDSQQGVASRLRINRSVMVKIVDALEARGEVVRARHASDRRSYSLELTDLGRARSAELLSYARALSDELTAPLKKAERKRLIELLARLVDSRSGEPLPAELLLLPAYLVTSAQELMEDFVDTRLAHLRLTVRLYVAIAIAAGQDCSQGDLSAGMMVGPAATVDLVDQAEALGALRRVRDASDRRSYRLELTAAGRELHARAARVVGAATVEFTCALSGSENDELVGLLTRISA